MAARTWSFQIDGTPHTVHLEHSAWSGSRVITIDGQVIERSRKVFDTGSEHRFLIGERRCLLVIMNKGLGFAFELQMEGAVVGEGGEILPLSATALGTGPASPPPEAEWMGLPVRNVVAGFFGLIAFMGLYFKTSKPVQGGATQVFDTLLIGIGLIGALITLAWPVIRGPR